MVLAALTKGPQGPVYFLTSVTVYLFLTAQWRRLFTRAHAAGILVGLAIVSAWMVPFYSQVGWKGVHDVWLGDSAIRFRDWKLAEVALHLVTFPLEIFGCTLPWSPLLFLYLDRRVRDTLRDAAPQLTFVTVCLVVSFPTCWLPPGGVSRYFAPLYPCLAVLIGALLDRCGQPNPPRSLVLGWRGLTIGTGTIMIAAAAIVLAAPAIKASFVLSRLAGPPGLALCYAAIAFGLAAVMFRFRQAGERVRIQVGVVALGSFMAISFTGVLTDLRIRRSENTAAAVERLKAVLPIDHTLCSFGHVDSLFAFYYGRAIVPLSWETVRRNQVDGVEYFAFYNSGTGRPRLPFAWKEIAAVSVDRNHQDPADTVVVVGRRLGVQSAKAGALATSPRAALAHIPEAPLKVYPDTYSEILFPFIPGPTLSAPPRLP
jgi:4-amino-4-deoxy-L-arabinose transferase-like glycosyltransferase